MTFLAPSFSYVLVAVLQHRLIDFSLFLVSHISLLSLMFKFFLILLMPAPLSWLLCSLGTCPFSLILRLSEIFRFILDFPTPALKRAMSHFFEKYCFPFRGEEFSETKIWVLGVLIAPRVSLFLVPLTHSHLKLFWAFTVPEYFSWILILKMDLINQLCSSRGQKQSKCFSTGGRKKIHK